MCGIVGVTNGTHVQPDLLTMLKRLEYRGYDSSGIAVVDTSLSIARSAGNIAALEEVLAGRLLPGHVGIGHTRWATHGAPTDDNAHPHSCHHVAVVHNGIIENHQQLKAELMTQGHHFTSQTDSEIIPHLVICALRAGCTPQEALHQAVQHLEGSFAIAMVLEDMPDTIFATVCHSPLVIGRSDSGAYLSSDQSAIADYADEVYYLEHGEVAILRAGKATLYMGDDIYGDPSWQINDITSEEIGLGGYKTFTQKEIAQQADVVRNTMSHPLNSEMLATATHLHIVACGSSYYAAGLTKFLMEQCASIPVTMHIASEFRYYPQPLDHDSVAICVSQSGETADTLAAMDYLQACHIPVVALTNSPHSQMARRADYVWHTHAGKEIGVAATKSFTSQALVLMQAALSQSEATYASDAAAALRNELQRLPALIEHVLSMEDEVSAHAQAFKEIRTMLFLGRGPGYMAAQEAALKVKELSYIQAEAYAAGELKHGPIALVEEGLPIWICAPYRSEQYGKIIANAQEVAARGAALYIVSNVGAPQDIEGAQWIMLPDASESMTALLFVVISQLLSTHIALIKGLDVDKPRNLAKSVTVE